MNRFVVTIFSTLLLFSSQLLATQGKVIGGQMSEHPSWFKESFLDIAEDVAEASENGKHVILFMHLNGCPYCYKMTEENFKNAPYTDFIQSNFDTIAINIKGDREIAFNDELSVSEKVLAQKLKVMYTPTIIFLNSDNKPVARINGYRSVPEFKHILDYVHEKAYQKTTLAKYIDQKKSRNRYTFKDHPQFIHASDLQKLNDKPLAVIFEDSGCVDCERLHNGYLTEDEVRTILKKYHVVRLDALSDQPITDPNGNKTTPKEWAHQLKLTYRPGIVLFDKGQEIMRIESLLYRYHFTEILRYVGDRLYKEYPNSFYDYLADRTRELTDMGEDIDLSK